MAGLEAFPDMRLLDRAAPARPVHSVTLQHPWQHTSAGLRPAVRRYHSQMTFPPLSRLRRPLCALLSAVLISGSGSAPAWAQSPNLPTLGDPASEELSPLQERRLGETIMREMRRERAVMNDVELTEWINRFGSTLVQASEGAGTDFEFFMVRDRTLNAFAFPGGFIGVHTGLVAAAQSESEVAGVLAHEIGHVTQRHIARMIAGGRNSSLYMLGALVLAALAAGAGGGGSGAMGMLALGQTLAIRDQLAFSRDAEREADRIGVQTLREAGYDTQAMVTFFGRLQQSGRLYENNAPAYMRSHPITAERMADIQARVRDSRYRQRPDSLDFVLAQARIRALTDESRDGLADRRRMLEQQISARTTPNLLAAQFGLAQVAAAQKDWNGAQAALKRVRAVLPGGGHPFVERLEIRMLLDRNEADAAVRQSRAARVRYPESRALAHVHAESLLAAREFANAVTFLEEQVAQYRNEPDLWEMLGRAHEGAGHIAARHRATGEYYARLGAWQAAIEQMQFARQANDGDFILLSVVDARLRELQVELAREKADRQR